MKKLISILLIVCFVFMVTLTGCGDPKTIDGKTYGTYGFFNEKTHKNQDIEYRVIVGNVVWSVLLVETIVFPIYFVGFSLYEPIDKKENFEPGVIKP